MLKGLGTTAQWGCKGKIQIVQVRCFAKALHTPEALLLLVH